VLWPTELLLVMHRFLILVLLLLLEIISEGVLPPLFNGRGYKLLVKCMEFLQMFMIFRSVLKMLIE